MIKWNVWLAGLMIGTGIAAAAAGSASVASTASTPVVLDVTGPWRGLFVHAPGIVRRGDRVEVWETNVHCRTVPVPAKWMMPEFDDSGWVRRAGPFGGISSGNTVRGAGSSRLSLICLRSYFTVTDLAASDGMNLSLSYRGGVVVYLNGREIARKHLPPGALSPETAAAEYPLETFFLDDTCKLGIPRVSVTPGMTNDPIASRVRTLDGVKISAGALQKGLNVLAVEIHRAPVPEAWTKLTWTGRNSGDWVQAGLVGLRVEPLSGVVAGRPSGVHVWNADVLESLRDVNGATPDIALRPIRLVAPINGVASGQIVIGGDQPIKGLKVETGAWRGPGAMPADAATLRYAKPDGGRFDVLDPAAPGEVSVRPGTNGRDSAVQPVWLTVNVPPDAAAGDYEGALTVSAEGMEPIRVAVKLQVAAWKAPAPRDGATFVDMIQSPESVALQYNVPLWSEKHWELLARTCRLLRQVGSRVVYLPLISRTNFGNSESMVRWSKGANGALQPDYTILERYLDVWEKNAGQPEVVCLYGWEIKSGGAYMGGKDQAAKGGKVTVVDATTGQTTDVETSAFGTPESEAFWKPVFDELRTRLNQRGIGDEKIMLGIGSDVRPSKTVADFFFKIAPYAQWILHTHAGPDKIGAVDVGYKAHVWNVGRIPDPAVKRLYGWKVRQRLVAFLREGCGYRVGLHQDSPLPMYRLVAEGMTLAGQRGMGRLGADFWKVSKDGRGNLHPISGRFPESNWYQLNLSASLCYMLAPGPTGALGTVRFEMLREGLQEAEARIVLEKALTTPAIRAGLGEPTATRYQELLDERTRWFLALNTEEAGMEWFSGAAWQEMEARIFAAAADVANRADPNKP